MNRTIESFRGKYFFLSNMYLSPFVDSKGFMYKSSEHYFQSHKAVEAKVARKIIKAITPSECKRLGRICKLVDDWDYIKDIIMKEALELKFQGELANMLISTFPCQLIEGNTWGDTYWGKVNGIGENKLGILLMELRTELMKE